MSGLVGWALFGFVAIVDSPALSLSALAGLLVAVPMAIGYGGRAWRLRARGGSVNLTVAFTVRLLAMLCGFAVGLLVNALWPSAGWYAFQ